MTISKNNLFDLFMITIGTIITGVAVFCFLMPSHLAIASISGLAVLLGKLIPFVRVSTLIIVLNVICLILSMVFVGKEFTVKTIYPCILQSGTIKVLDILMPNFQSITGDEFQDMVCYLFLVCLGLAMVFIRNASTGGIDVIAKILNKYFHMNLGVATSMAGLCISIPSIFIYDIKVGVISILGTYLNGIVLDHFIFGFSQKKKVCIISKKYEDIRKFIIYDMNSGVTIYKAYGGFNGDEYIELVAIVDKQEYIRLINCIQKIDASAIVTIYNVNDTRINPKTMKAHELEAKQRDELA